MDKINEIKNCVIKGFIEDNQGWFIEAHIKFVEKYTLLLIDKFPKADKDSLLLSVWLHDTGYLKNFKRETHEQEGADYAELIMKRFDYSQTEIDKVKNIIITHGYITGIPTSLEQKILSTADAMAHFNKDFYLSIAVLGKRDKDEFVKYAKNKLERDYNTKILFDEAREEIKPQYEIIKNFLNI